MYIYQEKFSDILKDFLRVNKLTQKVFADAIGVKQSQVSEWLSGKAIPGFVNLRAMCLAYGVSADFWLGLEN